MLITPGCDRVDRMMFISYNRQNPGLRKTFETFNTLKKPPAMSLSLPSPPPPIQSFSTEDNSCQKSLIAKLSVLFMSQDPSNCNLLNGQLILSEPNNGVLLNNFKMNVLNK